MYYRGANCMVIVYDISSVISFERVKFWVNTISKSCNIKDPLIVLVGNKNDLPPFTSTKYNRTEIIKSFIDDEKINFYIETSAKNNNNIIELFENIIYTNIFIKQNSTSNLSTLLQDSNPKSNHCCNIT